MFFPQQGNMHLGLYHVILINRTKKTWYLFSIHFILRDNVEMILPQNSQKTYFYKELFVVNLYLDFFSFVCKGRKAHEICFCIGNRE